MFVGILMRDLARDFCVEFESSRHRAIFEISSRTVGKLQGATLNEINTIKAYAIRFENYMYTFKMWKLRQKTVVVCLDTKKSTHFFGMNKPDGAKDK